MSWDNQERRWMAYLDGQMSASEALDFEASLTPRERARLGGEVRLESALHDSLTGQECCPIALWNKVARQMRHPKPKPVNRLAYWFSRTAIVVAATAAIVFTVPHFQRGWTQSNDFDNEVLGIANVSLDDFKHGIEVPANLAAAQAYLQDHGIDVKLVNVSGTGLAKHHDIEFVGVCEGHCGGDPVFELRFICCGKPAKVLVARRGTSLEHKLEHAGQCGTVRGTRESSDFITAVVCGHNSPGLLDVVQPAHGRMT